MAGVSFKNVARTALDDELAADATTMKILGGDWFAFTRRVDFYCLLLGAQRREIIKVTGGASPFYTIERGQEGTSAADWPRGTLCFQNTSAASFSAFVQYEAFRQGAYNPNGALTSLYLGEKFYQTDDEMWWKAVAAGSTEWRLIAGEIFIDDVVFDPLPGEYSPGQSLAMSVLAAGADIRYTDNGTDPDKNSTLYTNPISLPDPGPTTYKARGFGAYRWESPSQNITSGEYEIESGSWLEVIGTSGAHGNITDSLVSFRGNLYGFVANTGKLYQYDGDETPGWTLVADTPSGYAKASGGYRMAVTAQWGGANSYLWAYDTYNLLRWALGDTAWTKVALPYAGCYGICAYYTTTVLTSSWGSPSLGKWRYDISGNSWGSVEYPSSQAPYGNEPGQVTPNGEVLMLGYGLCWEGNNVSFSQNAYAPGESTWFRGAANVGGKTYVLTQTGRLYQYNKTGAWPLTIDDNWGSNIGHNIVAQTVSGTYRVWALQWANFSFPNLMSWSQGSSWTLETTNGYLPWTTPTDAIAAHNGSIYIANTTGHLAKYMGS